MDKLIIVSTINDITADYRQTPIGLLFEYHNFNRPHDNYNTAQILIGMCMDNRENIRIPKNFAFIIRDGGANIKYSEFKVSYAISIGGIKHIALIGHNDCGMVNLKACKKLFIKGLVDNGGWDKKEAEKHFEQDTPIYEIGNEIDFILSEAKHLRKIYPKICVAPMLYNIDDLKLYLINES